jgi:hypothetical protein
MLSHIETSEIPKPRYPALFRQDTTYPWNTDFGRYTHGWAEQIWIQEDEEEGERRKMR